MELKQPEEHIYVITDFWNSETCDHYVAFSEKSGYQEAPIDTGTGHRVVPHVRNNKRVLFKSQELADTLWSDLSEVFPLILGNSVAIGLNELFRFYRYEPGEEFRKHRDQSYIRNANEASYYTLLIYLNDEFEGGDTRFDHLTIQPKKGMALVFLHSLEHSGSPVIAGTKYVLRTDVMYRLGSDNSGSLL